MRIPVKSERDAFRLAYGIAAAFGLAMVVGALASALYGAVLLGGIVIGALIWGLAREDPDRRRPLREAADAAPKAGGGGRYRVLVVANETVAGSELREEIMRRAPRTPEVRVVCPILPSRAHYIASDIDRELAEARARLDATLAWATEHRITATGRVSEDTPLTAVADELRRFPAEELIVSTHPRTRSRWLESGLVERLRDELEIPVHHVVVDLERARQSAAARSA